MEWSVDLVMEFIDLIEGEPSIWNPKHEQHKNKNAVYDAWGRIRDNLSVEYSLKELKKKKDSLMATYRKITNKVKKSETSGSGTDTLYKPEWFAYERMATFLHAVYSPRQTTSSEIQDTEHHKDEETDDVTTPTDITEDANCSTITTNIDRNDNDSVITPPKPVTGGPPSGKKRKFDNMRQVEKRMDEAFLYIKEAASKKKPDKDETDLFCDLLCAKLKRFDETTRDHAMYEINNVMFNFKYKNMMANYSQPPQSPGEYSSPTTWSTHSSCQTNTLHPPSNDNLFTSYDSQEHITFTGNSS